MFDVVGKKETINKNDQREIDRQLWEVYVGQQKQMKQINFRCRCRLTFMRSMVLLLIDTIDLGECEREREPESERERIQN